jgi:multisubunit Na+/H+ antiporter MnhE subunit
VRKSVAIWVSWWVCLFVLWMSLVLTQATPEVIAGVVVAGLAATAAEVVRRSRLVQLLPWGLLPRHPVALAWTVLSDCWLLTVVLVRQLGDRQDNVGTFRGIYFEAGADDDPRAATRRAMSTALISLAPNTYVVGIDRENDNMLVHELVAGPRETTRERVLGKL